MDALSRLSEMSRQILALAKKEAAFFQHDQIRTEHLLLGIMADGDSLAGQVLAKLGIDPDVTRRQAAGLSDSGRLPTAVGDMPAAPLIPLPPVAGARLGADSGERPDADVVTPAPVDPDGSEDDHAGHGLAADRFERFTERAKKVLVLAQEEAPRFNHNYVGTEHLLLGLLREGKGVAVHMLERLGVAPERVLWQVIQVVGQPDSDGPAAGHPAG